MFQPTHLLVSRSKQTPVHLVPSSQGYTLYTEQEWGKDRKPAFEMRPKLGVFCQGIPVIGYHLQPLPISGALEDDSKTATTLS